MSSVDQAEPPEPLKYAGFLQKLDSMLAGMRIHVRTPCSGVMGEITSVLLKYVQ